MGVVHIKDGVVAEADFVEVGKGRQRAGHAVDAVDGDDAEAIVAGGFEDAFEIGGVAVAKRFEPRAVRLCDLRALLHRIVRVFVEDEQIFPPDQSGESPQIGEADGGVNERIFGPEPIGDLRLGFFVRPHRRERPRRSVMGSPPPNARANCFLHARILIEAQETVRAKIDDRSPIDHHLPMRAEFVDDDVLQVDIGELAREVLDEANQPMLPQCACEVLQRRA